MYEHGRRRAARQRTCGGFREPTNVAASQRPDGWLSIRSFVVAHGELAGRVAFWCNRDVATSGRTVLFHRRGHWYSARRRRGGGLQRAASTSAISPLRVRYWRMFQFRQSIILTGRSVPSVARVRLAQLLNDLPAPTGLAMSARLLPARLLSRFGGSIADGERRATFAVADGPIEVVGGGRSL